MASRFFPVPCSPHAGSRRAAEALMQSAADATWHASLCLPDHALGAGLNSARPSAPRARRSRASGWSRKGVAGLRMPGRWSRPGLSRKRRASRGRRRPHPPRRRPSASGQIHEARRAFEAEAAAARIYLGADRRLLARARSTLNEATAYQRGGQGTKRRRVRDATALAAQVSERAVVLAERYADAGTCGPGGSGGSTRRLSGRDARGAAAIVVVKDAT